MFTEGVPVGALQGFVKFEAAGAQSSHFVYYICTSNLLLVQILTLCKCQSLW